jgi:hypothetical protein
MASAICDEVIESHRVTPLQAPPSRALRKRCLGHGIPRRVLLKTGKNLPFVTQEFFPDLLRKHGSNGLYFMNFLEEFLYGTG